VCAAVRIPVVGIAGITPERVWPVLEAGAHGIAVMTAITTALDPAAATAAFRAEIDAFLAERLP
jgi:thiamine-phosphate pyrophosphorylase